MDCRKGAGSSEQGRGEVPGVGKGTQRGGREQTSRQESMGKGREGGMEVRSKPRNNSGHQTSIPALPEEKTHEMEQRRGEGSHIPTHRQGADEAVALQDRENRTPEVRMWRGTEYGTPSDLGMRGVPEKTLGRDLGRQGLLRESNGILEEPGEKGGGGKTHLRERRLRGVLVERPRSWRSEGAGTYVRKFSETESAKGWGGPEVEQSCRVSTRGCTPSLCTLV